jgi:hypothetical protein
MNMNILKPTILFFLICAVGRPAGASEFVVSVIDSATRQPLAARVYVENVDTSSRHFVRAHSTTDAVIYERLNWANKNSIEHHSSVPAAPFVAGNLTVDHSQVSILGKEWKVALVLRVQVAKTLELV